MFTKKLATNQEYFRNYDGKCNSNQICQKSTVHVCVDKSGTKYSSIAQCNFNSNTELLCTKWPSFPRSSHTQELH